MKFCIKCGTKLNDDDLFCYKCGTKCQDVADTKPAEEPKEESVPEPAPVVEEPVLDTSKEDEERKAKEEAERLEKEKREAEERARLEEEKKAEEERLRKEAEEQARLEEERRQKEAEEKARLEAEQKAKEERLKALEEERRIREDEATLLLEEENKLRSELGKEPVEAPKREATPRVEDAPKIEKEPAKDEHDRVTLIKHALFFTAILIGMCVIYWLIGSFVSIHIAIRVIVLLLSLGTMVIPVMELVKLVIYMIKNKVFDLFLVVTLGICQILMFVFVSINISALAS